MRIIRQLASAVIGAAALSLALASVVATSSVAHAADEEIQRGGQLNIILNPEPAILILALNQQTPIQTVGGKI
ncbi:MAG TPA: hypothetical protein VK973_00705, partial [Arenicellales bacterium]|nr:hypothetical protein [Arenicellales bacterium]